MGEHSRKEGGECRSMTVGDDCRYVGAPSRWSVKAREGREPKDIGSGPVGKSRQGGASAWKRGGVSQVLETFKERGGADAWREGEENYGKEKKRQRRYSNGASP